MQSPNQKSKPDNQSKSRNTLQKAKSTDNQENSSKAHQIDSEAETVHTLLPDNKNFKCQSPPSKFKLETQEDQKSLIYQISLLPLSPEKIYFKKAAPIKKKSFENLISKFQRGEDDQFLRRKWGQSQKNGEKTRKRKYSLESPDIMKIQILGKLMHSQGKFRRKRGTQKQKITKFRIKKKKRGYLCRKPVDSNKLRRNLLRKRKRDISRDKTPAYLPKCRDCNNFLTPNLPQSKTPKSDYDTKKKPRPKNHHFPPTHCWNCRKSNFKRTQVFYNKTAKNLIANYQQADQPKQTEKLFFRRLIKRVLPSKSISPEKSENSARSNSSGLSDLSDISLQNKKIKKEQARLFKNAKKIRELHNPNKKIFLSQSKRGGENMEVYTSQKERIIFPEKIKDKLHSVSVDDDFDTDEEHLKLAVNKVFQHFVKGLEHQKRLEAKKRRLHLRNSVSNF